MSSDIGAHPAAILHSSAPPTMQWWVVGESGVKLTDIGLVLVTYLILRVVYLVVRIERLLCRSSQQASRDAEAARASSALPHVAGVLSVAERRVDVDTTSEPKLAGPLAVDPPPDDSSGHPASGPSPGTGLRRAAHSFSRGMGSLQPGGGTLERQVTLGALQGPQIEHEVLNVITPRRRSSRGERLQQLMPSHGDSQQLATCTSQQLDTLDVLPLTTTDEAPLLTRMRIELASDLEEFPQYDDVSGDIKLLRFLRGYSHSVPQAVAAYRAMLATRRQHDVESIREKILKCSLTADEMPHGREVYKVYPIQLDCGLSRHGHVVSVDPVGQIRLRELMDDVGADRFFEFMLGVSELRQIIIDEMSVETGMLVQSVQIKDLHGMGMWMLRDASAVSTVQQIISTCTSMYPESLATLYFINAPFFFPMVWSVISNFLNERTKKKVHVLGTDYEEVLLKDVDPSVLQTLRQLHGNAAPAK